MLLVSMMLSTVASATPLTKDSAIDFAQLAPASSVVVVSAEDFSGMLDHLKATPLGGILELGPVKEAFEEGLVGPFSALKEEAEDHGVDIDMLFEPTSLGFALFTSLDEETGQTLPYILGSVEYGRNTDNAWDALENMLEGGRGEGRLELDSRDVRGREVIISSVIAIDAVDEDEIEFDNEIVMMLGDTSTLVPNMDTMYFVRDKSRVLVSNDPAAIDDALAVIDGDDIDSVDLADDYAAVQAMLGENDATAVVRFSALGELLMPVLMGPMGMVMPAVDEAFGSIEAFGVALAIADDPSAIGMARMQGAIYAPGDKSGILGLLNETKSIDISPSKSIPVDAVSFSRLNITFKDLIPLGRDMAAAIPMAGQEIDAMLDMYEPMIKPALDTLGPEMYQFSTIRRPIAFDSGSNVMMITAEQPDKVHPLLATIGPNMGLQPRDFNGETIWADDMQSMALAVSGNWLLFGDSRGIEQVIRTQGGGGESIADNPMFSSAARQLDDEEVVGWGWSDLVAQSELQRPGLEGGFDEFGPDDGGGFAPDVIEDISTVLDGISKEDMARYLGPLLWTLTSSDEGWTQRIWLLPPTKIAG